MNEIVLGAPDWALAASLTAAVLIAATAWSYLRAPAKSGLRALAAGLKMAAIIALALCLLEPLVSGTRPRPKANVFAILVDNSRSMRIEDRSAPTTKQLTRWLSDETTRWRSRLEQDFDVRVYSFDREIQRLETNAPIEFSGTGTRVVSAIESIQSRFQHRPIAGALLLTDGNATDQQQQLPIVDFPIYPVLGPEVKSPADLRIESVRVSQTNFETSPTTVWTTVAGTGFDGDVLVVELLDSKNEPVETQTIELDEETKEASVRFRFRPEESGISFYRLNVYPKDEQADFNDGKTRREATLANNSRTILVDRGGGPYRILYVGGRPNWEFKFLRRALHEDDEIELVGLLRIADKEPKFSFRDRSGISDGNQLFEGFDQRDPEETESYDQPVLLRLGIEDEAELRDGFPKSADELYRYHAIVLDDLEASFFSQDQMLLIRRFVSQRGGGLMMLGGYASLAQGQYHRTPLGELLPVYVGPKDVKRRDGPFRIELTREGWLEPWIRLRSTEKEEEDRLDDMPSFQTRNPIGDVKPGAVVVAEAQGRDQASPAIVTQRFGKGRTAAVMMGDLWRWSMRRDLKKPDDLPTYWRQSMRWLTADVPRRVEVEADSATADDTVEIRVTVRDEEFKPYDSAEVTLTISDPLGKSFEVTAESGKDPGVYSADYWPRDDGGYLVRANVTSADGNMLEARSTGWTSLPAAGEFQTIDANRDWLMSIATQTGGEVIPPNDLDQFVASLPTRKVPVVEPWQYPLWHQPLVLGFALFCLCAEWGLRRWKGLV